MDAGPLKAMQLLAQRLETETDPDQREQLQSVLDQMRQLQMEQWRRLKKEKSRRMAQTRLSSFVLYTFNGYDMGWFHENLCGALEHFLEQVIAGTSPRLIVCAPPRSGKSEIVSVRFPAWALGRYPHLEIIACSYSAELSTTLSRQLQKTIDDELYHDVFPDTCLGKSIFVPPEGIKTVRTADHFEVYGHKGAYTSAGVGGSITGKGAHILIVDDPVKDREAANSATIRNKTWDWFTSAAYTRLAPGGGVIVMCTRWHCDDLVGRLLANMQAGHGETYEHINYPAIAEEDEEFRKRGEPLHPTRFNLEALERIRRNVGERDWNALYQQRPVPEGGGMFKDSWIRHYRRADLPSRFDKTVISWDMTFNGSRNSDFVVGQVWGRKGGSFYLLDQFRGQWDFVQTVAQFTALSNKWPDVSRKLVEAKANGPAVISALRKDVSGIIPVTPKEGKEARASAISTFWEAGNVYLPDPNEAPWVAREFLPELLSFPAAPHDDQVDAMTQALNDMKRTSIQIHESNLNYLAAGY